MKHTDIAEALAQIAGEIFEIACNLDYYAGFNKTNEFSAQLIERASEIKFLSIDLASGDLDDCDK
jgi:hypothetical protein